MKTPWLSILLPSLDLDARQKFLDSLGILPIGEVELIIDDEKSDGMGEVFNRLFAKATGKWVWFGNDDLICEDPQWLFHFREATKIHPDGVALIYPNDKLFEETFCCFPLVRKDVIKDIFPLKFKKYKTDDCIMRIIPRERYVYLDNVVMRHMNFNVHNQPGHLTKSGKVYPIYEDAVKVDQPLFDSLTAKLAAIRQTNERRAGMVVPEQRILIGCITAEFARRADFYDYFNAMVKPVGSVSTFAHGQSPAENRNIIIDQAFDVNATHIFFMDDDIVFKPTMLMELLAHNKDIVTGLMFKRNYPHAPLIFDLVDDLGRCRHKALDPNESGLIEVVASGLGCCLVKMDVFRKLEKPFIRLGELDKSGWNDDIGFFKRVREAGFKIYCDLDVRVGHIASVILWPDKINGEWMTTYDTYGSGRVSAPQFKRSVPVEAPIETSTPAVEVVQ